jgi:hypothetical protein
VRFDATLSVSSLRLAALDPARFENRAETKSTSRKLSCPSTFPDETPLFLRPFRSVRKTLLFPPEVPPLGFGYPFDGFGPFYPWKPLSVSNIRGLSSFRASFLFDDRKEVSSLSFRFRAFFSNRSGLGPAP